MLKKPVTSLNLGPTTLGNALWSRSLARSTDLGGWHWRLRDCGATQSSNQTVLLGETMLDSRLVTKLVVLSIEPNGPTFEVFHDSLEHLEIDRVPVNGIHPSEEFHNPVGTPSNPIPLYSPILWPEQRNLLDLLIPPNEVVQLGFGTHFILHRFTELDDLPPKFAWSDYVDTLKTRNLGRTMIWTETMESSWDFCLSLVKNLPADSGVLVVSNQQTSAKGRGDNKWISPFGQASFTFHLTLTNPLSSNIEPQQPFSNFVTCLQHLVALSVVLACRQLIAEQLRGSCDDTTNADEEFLCVSVPFQHDTVLCKRFFNSSLLDSDRFHCNQGTLETLALPVYGIHLQDPQHNPLCW
ncbi:unnamed protein product [Dicrocoelium dendriticum]|nr:unnamed protein product [Dicrocoelium dendriticum]